MGKPIIPTGDEKLQILHPHVFYGIQQLAGLFLEPASDRRPFFENARVESIASNCRNLVFFETKVADRKDDDVVAEDFGFPASVLPIQVKVRHRVNKEVAHITYSRIEHDLPGNRGWPYPDFVPLILKRSADFITHLLATNQTGTAKKEEWQDLKLLTEMVVAAIKP